MWPDQLKITENIILLSAFGVNINLKNKGKMLLIKLRQKIERNTFACVKPLKKIPVLSTQHPRHQQSFSRSFPGAPSRKTKFSFHNK